MNPDQFISENLFINSFVFRDTDNVTDTILTPHVKKHNYVKIFKFIDLTYVAETHVIDMANEALARYHRAPKYCVGTKIVITNVGC